MIRRVLEIKTRRSKAIFSVGNVIVKAQLCLVPGISKSVPKVYSYACVFANRQIFFPLVAYRGIVKMFPFTRLLVTSGILKGLLHG